MAVTAERIREIYNETKPNMPSGAKLVIEVERRLKQRQAIGAVSGRTRDEVMQAVCEDMAREACPKARAEQLFAGGQLV
jgi:hypothetical protein